MAGHAERWWTLGFEAFGDLECVSTNLTLTVLPERPVLERIVARPYDPVHGVAAWTNFSAHALATTSASGVIKRLS